MQRSLAHLSDGTLRQKLASLVSTDRTTTAQLLRHLAEFETRRLFARDGYPSMFAYCVKLLRFSEDMAFKRIRVARAARRCPALLEAIADGRLHLTGAVLLARHLKAENWESLLTTATHKTKSEIEHLLAQRFPQKDVPTLVQAIPNAAPPRVVPPGQVAPGPVGQTGGQAESRRETLGAQSLPGLERSREVVPEPVDQSSNGACAGPVAPESPPVSTPPTRLAPLAPGRYLLQTTIGQSAHDKLRRLQDLLGPQVPSGDVAQVLERAFDALIEKLEKAKHAATDRPRRLPSKPSADPHHVPAEVKRQVLARDGGRCTYVSENGERCAARKFLEYDHIQEVVRGGSSSVANVRLLCRTHNQLEAERSFGAEFMRARRKEARARSHEARAGVNTHPG